VKFLLIPLAVVAFVLFLLLLGAIGLVVAMGVLACFGRIWRFVSGGSRGRARSA
jgi:hypothetical protein